MAESLKNKYALLLLIIVPFITGSGVLNPIKSKDLTICSFNIQFLGHFKKKDDAALASILKDYDIIVIQELVAPPIIGTYPDGTSYSKDAEAEEFYNAMHENGFDYKLSEEDTGTNDEIHKNSSATEWWIAFYKPSIVDIVDDIPSGFLAGDRSNNIDFERVPYAFSFRTDDKKLDFVLISVHLQPGKSSSDRARRKHELSSIRRWIDANDDIEKDFIILGDMNIYSHQELVDATPAGYVSLNDECRPTNTNTNGPEPYDHVMFNPNVTTEIDKEFDFEVINLIEAMKPFWQSSQAYPGNPYDHQLFRQYYSDHHPVIFKMVVKGDDD